MGIEDGGVLFAEFGSDRIAIPLDFPGCLGHGVLKPGKLRIDGTPLHEAARNPKALAIEDERFADRDAGRNGDSLEFEHWGRISPAGCGVSFREIAAFMQP
jgi:hypothetical protein